MSTLLLVVAYIFSGNAAADTSSIQLALPAAALPGTLVSTTAKDSHQAELTDIYNCSRLKGVVIGAAQPGGKPTIAYAGSAQMYVSDIAGGIAAGDQVGCSLIAGVGAKHSDQSDGQIAGEALAAFLPTTAVSRTITGADGRPQTVHVGSIPVLLQLGTKNTTVRTTLYTHSVLLRAAQTITGKQPSPWQVIVALILLSVGILLSSLMIVTGIRYTLIANGRNPLAAPQTRATMRRIVLSALSVLFSAIGVAYILLII